VKGGRDSPLLDNGISLISIDQWRGNRHAYGAVSLGQHPIEPGRKINTPTEDAMESHWGRTILRFLVVTLKPELKSKLNAIASSLGSNAK